VIPVILRGQSVRWRMKMMSGDSQTDLNGVTWGVAETQFKVLPYFENGSGCCWLCWTAEQTESMTTGRKKLRLKLTQPNGDVRVLPDLFIVVQ
jgi:hypothetical protein